MIIIIKKYYGKKTRGGGKGLENLQSIFRFALNNLSVFIFFFFSLFGLAQLWQNDLTAFQKIFSISTDFSSWSVRIGLADTTTLRFLCSPDDFQMP